MFPMNGKMMGVVRRSIGFLVVDSSKEVLLTCPVLSFFRSLPFALHPFRHAQYSLGNYSEAVKAYTQGLTIDPANSNMQQALAQAKAKEATQQVQNDDSDDDAEDGEVARGGGGGGGAGGMPDLSSMADLLGGLGGGGNGTGGPGGMPDLAGLMSNPAIMQMYVCAPTCPKSHSSRSLLL